MFKTISPAEWRGFFHVEVPLAGGAFFVKDLYLRLMDGEEKVASFFCAENLVNERSKRYNF